MGKSTPALPWYGLLLGAKQAGVKLFIGSKVQCVFCFEICISEGRGGEKGGGASRFQCESSYSSESNHYSDLSQFLQIFISK